ncbi:MULTISPECIES: DinB family protein [Sphingobacterium]|uniref:DinB family protein n=1 Tax=Sphingobacterium TaxID=28453 RepID=UPI00257D7999|nr:MULTISPECIES: DinB family protein [Sphingobacterium]
MERRIFIADRLREAFLNGRWIANTNYQEQLLNTTWEQAMFKINDLNSIAALTYHINYYLEGLLAAFTYGKLEISDKYSFDIPPIQSKADWDTLVDRFLKNAKLFCDCIASFDENLFDQPFIDKKYGSYLRNIEAVIEHSYYHLGQISLIKKLILQSE